jgi:hypothetical protein
MIEKSPIVLFVRLGESQRWESAIRQRWLLGGVAVGKSRQPAGIGF